MKQEDYIKSLLYAFKCTRNESYLKQARVLLDKLVESNRQLFLLNSPTSGLHLKESEDSEGSIRVEYFN